MFRKGVLAVLLAGVGGVGTAAAIVPAAAPALELLPHRAVYDLKLKEASERSGIDGMQGRMVYEFTGSQCKGYTTNFRFVTRINTGEEQRTTDQQTKTFENARSDTFSFETKSFTDELLDKEVAGSATVSKDAIKVDITRPDRREIQLTPGDFPTGHMREVIRNAKLGKTFFEARVFDGSDDGDESLLTTTIVGKEQAPRPDDADASRAGPFATDSYWPVTVAYFNEKTGGDAVPVYRMSFKLHENGITRDLTLDYGDFVLSGHLSRIEPIAPEKCD